MIQALISLCLRNRFLVIAFYVMLCGYGWYALHHTAVDAIPDLSENQVIVIAEWPGRSAQEVEDQVTYPLSTSLRGLAGVSTVRAQSAFGFSMLWIIFQDDTDLYFARTRVLERIASLPIKLPVDVKPQLGPDATGLGWVYQYYLDDSKAREEGRSIDLGELRSLQDFLVRYQLNAVPGVAEVASIGGYVRQYQVDVDPHKLHQYDLDLKVLFEALQGANRNVGGGNIEINGREITLRGLGLVTSVAELAKTPVGMSGNRPILLSDVARVNLGPDTRRGALDINGREIVGGIIVMRQGADTKTVIAAVKEKAKELQNSLPRGVELRPFYDRSELIDRAVDTLRITLLEELILVTLAHLLFLRHFRSILIVTLPLPMAILMSFILMQPFGISSNIMSLSGIAIAIGVLVDAGIVVTEAVMREARAAQENQESKDPDPHALRYPQDLPEIVQRATALVARPVFFAMAIIILAFIPVFALGGQEGRLFHPLAFTKTFAMAASTLLAMTLVPVLCSLLVRGHIHDENDNGLMRFLLALYRPSLSLALRHKFLTIFSAFVLLAGSLFAASQMGQEFMPPLNERALLFMPTTVPGASLPEIKRVMSAQDKILAQFPEVESAVGKLGRADTATDPAPISMIETTIALKPPTQWRAGMTQEKLVQEMSEKIGIFPGFVPAFLQPIENRVLMLNTGVRAQVAVKLMGDDLLKLEQSSIEIEELLRKIPGAADVYAERVSGSPYLEIQVKQEEAARYGVGVDAVLDQIETAIGGRVASTVIDGRKRFDVRVRYPRENRNSIEALRGVLLSGAGGEKVPLGKVADFTMTTGPAMISSENGLLRVVVQCNVRGRDLGGFVQEAKKRIAEEIALPTGTVIAWGGQYENLLRARKTLMVIVPMVLVVIFILLFITYNSFAEAAHVLLAVPFALSGGLLLQAVLGYPFSVAVWVGYIALFGTAVQTGVVMVIYLEEAVNRRKAKCGDAFDKTELRAAVMEGALLRLRPKVMTVATIVASLMVIMTPMLSGERTGLEVMRPIAVPVIGGMISSLLHILIVTPVIFLALREQELRREKRVHTDDLRLIKKKKGMNYKHTLALLPLSICIYVALYFSFFREQPPAETADSTTQLAAEEKASATARENPILELTRAYLQIQKTLAADSTEGIREQAQQMARITETGSSENLHQLTLAAEELMRAADITTARKAFKPLSLALITLLKAAPVKNGTLFLGYCSMSEGYWIQDKPEPIRNPYYGAEMLECGEITLEL